MKKFFPLVSFFLFLMSGTFAQRATLETGIFTGVSFYKGDLGSEKIFYPGDVYPAAGASVKARFTPHCGLKLSVIHGKVSAADSQSEVHEIQNRNLSFESDITEMSLTGEWDILPFNPAAKHKWAPFIFGGVGAFRFNPKTEFEGEKIALQPLGTEGQMSGAYPDRKPYSLINITIPFGAGIRWNLSRHISISAELGIRYTMTDYLDDVSTTYVDPALLSNENGNLAALLSNRMLVQPANMIIGNNERIRGDATSNDWYYFGGFTVSYRLKSSKKNFYAMMTTDRVKCASFR